MSVYHEEMKVRDTQLLREVLQDLPPFLAQFFRSIAQTTSAKTRLNYAYDLRVFFRYLYEEHRTLGGIPAKEMKAEDLNQITTEDIDEFMEYLSYYINPQAHTKRTEYHNDERGKARKLASVRSMFKYFYKKGAVTANPAAIVDTPKIHEKTITRLDVDEVANLLDAVESGQNLTKGQQARHEKTKKRDLALMMLMLGTGMRVSECVGINRKDLDFQNNAVKVLRKGGNEVLLYFGDEVREALLDYLEERNKMVPKEEDEDALFLSSQNRRLGVRAVQNLVKKYASGVTLKHITPHKLRSTYGTNLYLETGDIYLVADALGHADVNTTTKHYAKMEEDHRRKAASYIKLRKE